MEQFSPNSSKIFTGAAFANLFSSTLVVILRWVAAVILILLLFLFFTNDQNKLFYLVLSISIIYLVFEIFYEEKTLKEQPVPLSTGQNNLAESFEFNTARFILKNARVASLSTFLASLFNQNKIAFVTSRADVTAPDLNKKILSDPSITKAQFNFVAIVPLAGSWAKKEGRGFIDILDIFLAIFSTNKKLQEL